VNIYQNWLAQLPGIGNKKKIMLVSIFGNAKEIFYAKEETLRNLEKDKKKILTCENLKNLCISEKKEEAEKRKDSLEKKGIKLITYEDAKYPKRLQHIPDPPYQLFYFGQLPEEEKPALAIIGARECTSYGENMARKIGYALGKNGVEVISGMAKGIDGISQIATINAGGRSFAVLGSGVDICYPNENQKLYEILKSKGGIFSEYIPGTTPKPFLFPPRNRIISGLADGVIVVEARKKSGTQITVDMALEQGKDIYVVPGRMTDGLSEGCNQLIKEGAQLMLSVDSFIKEYFEDRVIIDKIKEEEILRNLSKGEREVYQCMDYYPKNLNQVIEELLGKQNITEIMNHLLSLEIKKYILRVAINSYVIRGGN